MKYANGVRWPGLEVVETKVFAKKAGDLLEAEELDDLKLYLAVRPDAGPVIPRGGGLRKLRWGVKGRGKSGGARIIYYWQDSRGRLYLITIFGKNERSDLTRDELTTLRKLIEKERDR